MGITTNQFRFDTDMTGLKKCIKAEKMDSLNGPETLFDDVELYSISMSNDTDDIWKKFDLLTPPGSPMREDEFSIENMIVKYDVQTPDVLTFFDETEANIKNSLKEMTFPESPPETDLNTILIQDPMWSAASKFDNGKVNESDKMDKRLRCDSCSGPNFDVNTSDCVDPLSVFQYQIGGALSETKVHSLGIETPSDSDEEIDVVTVEKKLQVSMPTKRKYISMDSENGTKTVTLTIETKPVQTQTHKIHKPECPTNVHNYSLPPKRMHHHRSVPSSPPSRQVKRLKRELSVTPDLKRVAQKLKPMTSSGSSRNSSDSEECETGKRTQHNVLERKRRTDLKLSFFHLRDSVPELQGQERAPKVLILRKAASHIHKLIEDQRRHEREIEQLKLRKEELKRTLSRLRNY